MDSQERESAVIIIIVIAVIKMIQYKGGRGSVNIRETRERENWDRSHSTY